MLTARDLEFFAAVARAKSLSDAARALDVSVSAVSQRLQQLEARLGVRLMARTSRRLGLTAEGELLAQRGQAISTDLERLAEEISSRRGVVSGLLRVSAPFGFGRAHVAPAVASFVAAHPQLQVELVVTDNLGRGADAAWDLAVHIGTLQDSSLVAQRLAPNERMLCASPAFIQRYGAPERPADLKAFDCIALRENAEDVTLWRFTGRSGDGVAVRIEPRLASNDGDIVRQWAVDGRGIVARSEWSVAADLRAGHLVRVLPEFALPSADIVVLLGPRHGRSARTTAFVQHLKESLSPPPWRSA